MDLSFLQWSALTISIGFVVSAWLYSATRDWCLQHWKFLCHAVLMEGPPALPLIGNAHWFADSPGDLVQKLTLVAKRYTVPFRLWLGPKLCIVIINPSDIEKIISNLEATYIPSECRLTESFFGIRRLMRSSGQTHGIHRDLITSMVNGKTLEKYVESFDVQARRCIERLENMIGKEKFDILPFMDKCTIDIIMDTIIGCPALAEEDYYSELVGCIIKLFSLSHERTSKIWLHPDRIYFNTQRGKEYKKAVAVVNKFMDNIVAKKKKEYYDSKTADSDSSDLSTAVLLEQLVAHNEANKIMDDIRLRDEVFTVFLAAQDPTALTCASTLMMLGMHPEIQDKVRTEVREIVGDKNLTANIVSNLKYLDMVIMETLRLFPIGSVLLRETVEDLELDTCTAPKGCTIAMFLFMTNRDPRFWNEPDKFDPDRFTPENSVGRHPCTFLPFASGFKGCIGQQYAMMMMKSLVARVIQKYRLDSHESSEILKLNNNSFTRASNSFKVSITKL